MQYQLLYRENQKEAFLPHEGFPHNNLTIPLCLVFWWVSIPWARSILGTVHGAKVIISRSVMKLFRQKDWTLREFHDSDFCRLIPAFSLHGPQRHLYWAASPLNAVTLVLKRYQRDVITRNFCNKQFVLTGLVPLPHSGSFCRTFTSQQY